MATSAQQVRAWQGPAILSYGFRPFFLGGAVFAAFAMIVWIGVISGLWSIPSAYDAIEWHAHELLWGYVPAVIAGFMLTAIPNWTGRLPVVGKPLAILWMLWFAGRLAMFFSVHLPIAVAAVIDLTFLAALNFVVARELVAGRNWHNLKVLAAVAVLMIGNVIFHMQAIAGQAASGGLGVRIGIAAAILLITIIGGRIIPSFTRNWLAKRGPGRLPAQSDRADQVVLAVTALALAVWTAFPEETVAGVLGLLAGLLNVYRLLRWAGWRTFAEPLVTILHAGYAFVPIGFIMTGASSLWPDVVPQAAARHAWMAGGIAIMTLAVMTRASLGHTGRPLTAGWRISAIYASAIAAAVSRIAAGMVPGVPWLLEIAGMTWILAFAGFALVYAPLLALRRAA